MPRPRRTWRIARDEYAVSAITASGLRLGTPGAGPGHPQLSHDCVEDGRVAELLAVAGETDLRGQPTAGPAERLTS